MKHLKKIVSLLLTAVMVLAMCIPVMADTNKYTITVSNAGADHTYEAYQVFKGNISDGKLTDIDWGSNVKKFTYNGKDNAQDIAALLTDVSTAEDFAKEVAKNLSSTEHSAVTPENTTECTIGNLDAGYYLIKDKDNTVPENSSYTNFILKVVGNVTVTTKMDVPTVEKKVKENVKNVNESGEDTDVRIPDYKISPKYNDVADYNIGDKVPFELIGTMPSNVESYKTYYYEFVDTLSKGLTYDTGSMTIVLKNSSNNTISITVTPNVVINSDETTSLNITFDDIKASAKAVDDSFEITSDTKVIVDYTATLNENANIGMVGNVNEVYLKFSNNPNGDGKGKTPEDKVIVFTYELDTKKVDGADNKKLLKNAEFVLKNADGNKYAKVTNEKFAGWVDKDQATKLITGDDGLIKVAGLDDGTYRLEETKAPDGYNKLSKDVIIIITAATKNGQTWDGSASNAIESLNVKADGKLGTADVKTGIVTVQIENNSGSTLPETGGIGTTIFYVVGVILMLGAGVLLVTKKRMSSNR